jgi:hypothetical protein
MIGFIDTLYNHTTHTYKKYSAVADLHTFQFTVAHALGLSVSTSRVMATDPKTAAITSNIYGVFLSFLLQPPWTVDSPELDLFLQFCFYAPLRVSE